MFPTLSNGLTYFTYVNLVHSYRIIAPALTYCLATL